jgi:hypothetical protein
MTKPRNPREHFRREKERRANAAKPESELMAAARREYEALLAAQATKGKGGRPKKTAAKRPVADEVEDERLEDASDE